MHKEDIYDVVPGPAGAYLGLFQGTGIRDLRIADYAADGSFTQWRFGPAQELTLAGSGFDRVQWEHFDVIFGHPTLPDGSLVAMTHVESGSGPIHLNFIDIGSGSVTSATLAGSWRGNVSTIRWHPAEQRAFFVAAPGSDGQPYHLYRVAADGTDLTLVSTVELDTASQGQARWVFHSETAVQVRRRRGSTGKGIDLLPLDGSSPTLDDPATRSTANADNGFTTRDAGWIGDVNYHIEPDDPFLADKTHRLYSLGLTGDAQGLGWPEYIDISDVLSGRLATQIIGGDFFIYPVFPPGGDKTQTHWLRRALGAPFVQPAPLVQPEDSPEGDPVDLVVAIS